MKIDIYGNGAEIVIGKLSEKQTQKIFPLLAKKEDGIDESEFESIMEKPWNEIDNIFHWSGAFGGNYGFYITNEKEEEIKPEGILNFNFDDDDCFTNKGKDGVDTYQVGINKFKLLRLFLSIFKAAISTILSEEILIPVVSIDTNVLSCISININALRINSIN